MNTETTLDNAVMFQLPAQYHSLFNPGAVVITAGVMSSVDSEAITKCLQRHLSGDWGDLNQEDRTNNDRWMVSGSRLLSVYKLREDLTLWIITEWDRSVTTILLPSEY